VFFLGKPFQTCLIFWGNVKSLHKSGTSEKYFTLLDSGLTHKH
jgi:hypothetical protein